MKKISRRARPHSITLYNYLSTTDGVAAYQRTLIERVYLDLSYAQRLSQRGIATADSCRLILDLRDINASCGRTFLDQKIWRQLSADEKNYHFTFATGNDFFVAGEAEENLPSAIKAQIVAKHQCFGISAVAVLEVIGGEAVIVEVTGK